jgi:hypothetical protein
MSDNPTGFSESFLLGTIAAFGGLITVVFAAIRKSRCTNLNCCGMTCMRTPMSEKSVLEEIKLENLKPTE